jgi:hypothetical protein
MSRPVFVRVPEGTLGAVRWQAHGAAPECWMIACAVDLAAGTVRPSHLSLEHAVEAIRLARSRQRRREAMRVASQD